ncbi:MAG: phytoene desaturase family protein [Dehalococcoidia bacterium]
MSTKEKYDIVIIGGGHNGITAAAYLAKCGLSVCVLEERPEVGGGQENTEPMAGVRIDPHATYLYAGPSPGFEQLELWKYGFRMCWNPMLGTARDPERRRQMGVLTTDGVVPLTDKDIQGWDTLMGIGTQYPFLKDLLRAVYWCPPHPPEMQGSPEDVPWVQVLKEKAPEVWSESILEMNLFDLMDEFVESEPFKVSNAAVAWYSGAAPHWEGMAIQSFAGAALLMIGGLSVPRGGMHQYAHAIVRCAIAHGARVRTCCPVEEIIIRNGRAVGVRLRDDAAWGEKTILADKAVLSDVDVKQTFLKLVGPSHTDPSFRQRIKDISYKGGSIYCAHILLADVPRYGPAFEVRGDEPVSRTVYPCDSREVLLQHIADVDSRKVTPSLDPDKMLWLSTGAKLDEPTMLSLPGRFLESPFYFMVPAPEYHAEGPDAVNKQKPQIDAAIIRSWSQVAPNVADNVVAYWSNSPYDSEFRNIGLIAGNWYATRHCQDQWWNQRPLPELSRYRTPIDGLYLCHQTSHPGGLCLMAVPYNLMHILIEDGIAQPGDWWYPSPHYRREEKKKATYV